ncbi:uncharacterized protein LOC134013750 [Osmerus eperlanus]|uniref:uncharacterized protein LOC134013749 n=1 Tax=Osmerus eperlanus TaxID=29151 RepID=UPI002E10515E
MLSEEDFVKAVIPHLQDGLSHFSAVCDTLFNVDHSENFKAAIQKAVTSLNESETVAKSHLDRVDEYTEESTQRKGKLESECQSLQTDLANLQTQCKAIKDNMSNYKYALEKAKNEKESAERHLQHCRNKARESQKIRDAGICLMFIPFIGTIAGAVMMDVGQAEMDQAKWRAKQSQNNVNRFASLVNSHERQLALKKQEKGQNKIAIERNQNNIQKNDISLREVKIKRPKVAGFQSKLREAVNFLSVLSGRADVALTVTSQVILLEPLIIVMTEVLGLCFEAAGDEKMKLLMQGSDMYSTIESLKNVHKKFSSITGKQSALSEQFY